MLLTGCTARICQPEGSTVQGYRGQGPKGCKPGDDACDPTIAGLAPEMVWFHPTDDMQAGSNANQLRPEVLESFFYMWRFTGDVMYQQWGWQIFLAFEKYSKVESGYAGLEVRQ